MKFDVSALSAFVGNFVGNFVDRRHRRFKASTKFATKIPTKGMEANLGVRYGSGTLLAWSS
jgi:hypothetical protein